MRKLSGILLILAAFFIFAGTASAITYTDDYANWPGYEISTIDQIGTPAVGDMTITIQDGYLESIAIDVLYRRVWDSLFINTESASVVDQKYEAWNYYYVWNDSQDSGFPVPAAPATGFYAVSNLFDPSSDYITSTEGRIGHPSGIPDGFLTKLDPPTPIVSVNYDGSVLLYTFMSDTVYVGDEGTFTIGYTPWCANDVFLTPVPEPYTLLLLGLGLLGVGIVRKMS